MEGKRRAGAGFITKGSIGGEVTITAKGGRARGGDVSVKSYRHAKTGKLLERKRVRPKTA